MAVVPHDPIERGMEPLAADDRSMGAAGRAPGLEWWPISVLRELPRSAGMRIAGLAWVLASLAAVATGVLTVASGWSGIPLTAWGITFDVTIYPPLVITFLLAVWLGPAWSVVPAYATTLVLARYSGMSWPGSALFALASPIEVLIFWGAMVVLDIHPELRRRHDYLRLLFVGVVACVASSVAVLVWNREHQLDPLAGQRIWRGWVFGALLQVAFLLAPLLRWGGAPARRWLARRIPVPAERTTSLRTGVGLVSAIFLMLSGLLAVGVVALVGSLDVDALATSAELRSRLQTQRELILYLGVGLGTMLLVLVVFAWALARLSERERDRAWRDPLTGCLNRRAFHATFRVEAERGRRLGTGLSLVMFDIDHFKQVNDRYGHGAGDEVLRQLTRRAQQELRPTDRLFRWGGEEFVALLPHTNPDAARVLAERLRTAVSSRPLVQEVGHEPLSITLSLGTAGARVPSDSAEDLLARADGACYAAKQAGRNSVVADLSEGAPAGP